MPEKFAHQPVPRYPEYMENSEMNFLIPSFEQPKTLEDYEQEELDADLSVFPERLHHIMQKGIDDQSSLTKSEAATFRKQREEWFYNKYGFPYEQKTSREAVFRKKYYPPEAVLQANDLQEKFFATINERDLPKFEELKIEYQEKYPDQLEGVEALFGLEEFLYIQKQRDEGIKFDSPKETFEDMTRYQFLITHFIENNSSDKEFLKLFWNAAEKLARSKDVLRTFHAFRRGVLSQVATYKTFVAIGKEPVLSHPREDAFESIDLWISDEEAVQIKSPNQTDIGPSIVPTETISFPGIQLRGKKSPDEERQIENYYNTSLFDQFSKMKVKISDYGTAIGKNLHGYLFIIPPTEFDPVTGEPSKEIIEFMKKEMGSLLSPISPSPLPHAGAAPLQESKASRRV